MSIDISVGVLVGSKEDWNESPAFHEHYLRQFEAINDFLRANGLPEHREPLSLIGTTDFHRSAKSELYPFRDFAEEVESRTGFEFRHLLECGRVGGIFLPLPFDQPLVPHPKFGIEIGVVGSSYRLFEECRILAKILGIYGDIEFEPIDRVVADIDAALEAFHRISEDKLPIPRPESSGHQWPIGAGGCHKLYEAAKFSVKHKAAVCIH